MISEMTVLQLQAQAGWWGRILEFHSKVLLERSFCIYKNGGLVFLVVNFN